MRVATGQQIFFDKIAEGLQVFWASDPPKRIGLSQNPAGVVVPDADIRLLARALCRLHAPLIDNIPDILWSDNNWDGIGEAAIFDAEDHKLSEVCAKLNNLQDVPAILVIICFEDDGTDFPKLTYDPRSQSDIVSCGLDALFSKCSSHVSALARARYESIGFKSLETDFGLFEQPKTPDWQDQTTLELLYYRLSRAWNYRGSLLPAQTIQAWCSQLMKEGFGAEAHQILVYLQQYGFVTEAVVAHELFRLYSELKKSSNKKTVEISIQKPGKSEQKLAYLLRPYVFIEKIEDAINLKNTAYLNEQVDFYCFDDCIGSGESIEKYLFDKNYNTCSSELIKLFRSGDVRLNVVVYHADERGIDYIQKHHKAYGAVKVHASRVLDETHQAFSETSRIFRDKARREAFKHFCLRVGEHLNPGDPLGWEGGQLCIAYDYTIPDNSLPILYGEGNARQPWKPLFIRAR